MSGDFGGSSNRELMTATLDTCAQIHRPQVQQVLQVIELYERDAVADRDILVERASNKVATKETVRAVIRKLERRFGTGDGPPPGEDSTRNELFASKTCTAGSCSKPTSTPSPAPGCSISSRGCRHRSPRPAG